MKTMTEKEKKLSELYKKYQHAKRRLEMGKENRDYAAMIAELEWQMNELMGNNISDGILALKKIGSTDWITNYIVLLVEKKNEIGRITYKTKDMVGLLNYKFDENAPKMGYDLRAIKLVIEQMKKSGIEKVEMAVFREDKSRNDALVSMGGRINLSKITPYNEYTIKIK